MSDLPPQTTPLNQHSIRALEQWLDSLGASRVDGDPCLWSLVTPEWTAELQLEREAVSYTHLTLPTTLQV